MSPQFEDAAESAKLEARKGRTITFEQVAATLREVVAERPEYVYEAVSDAALCTYSTPTGQPSCIVGQVIHRLDPEGFEQVFDCEWDEDGFVSSPPADDLNWVQENLTAEQAHALRSAQIVQDSGLLWRDALVAFEDVVKGL